MDPRMNEGAYYPAIEALFSRNEIVWIHRNPTTSRRVRAAHWDGIRPSACVRSTNTGWHSFDNPKALAG